MVDTAEEEANMAVVDMEEAVRTKEVLNENLNDNENENDNVNDNDNENDNEDDHPNR